MNFGYIGIFELENTNGITNHKDFYEHAVNMRNASILLLNDIDKKNKNSINKYIPWITLEAFSCELFLKSIINYETGNVKGHELKELFYKISEKTRNLIKRNTDNIYFDSCNEVPLGYNFEAKLSGISNSFVDWRYCVEVNNSKLTIDMTFLYAFCDALKIIYDEIRIS